MPQGRWCISSHQVCHQLFLSSLLYFLTLEILERRQWSQESTQMGPMMYEYLRVIAVMCCQRHEGGVVNLFGAITRSTVATKERTLVIICSDSLLQTWRGRASRGAIILRVSVDPSSSAQMFVGISGIHQIRWPHRGADFTAALCISYIRMRRAMCASFFPPTRSLSIAARHYP